MRKKELIKYSLIIHKHKVSKVLKIKIISNKIIMEINSIFLNNQIHNLMIEKMLMKILLPLGKNNLKEK